jgi:hypothetical protein
MKTQAGPPNGRRHERRRTQLHLEYVPLFALFSGAVTFPSRNTSLTGSSAAELSPTRRRTNRKTRTVWRNFFGEPLLVGLLSTSRRVLKQPRFLSRLWSGGNRCSHPRSHLLQLSPLQRPGRLSHHPFRGLLDVDCTLQPTRSPSPANDLLSEASAVSSPPRLLRLLPAGARVARWVYLPLGNRAFARRTFFRVSRFFRSVVTIQPNVAKDKVMGCLP